MTPDSLRSYMLKRAQESEDYPYALVSLSDSYRVILSVDLKLFILQTRVVRPRYIGKWRKVAITENASEMRKLAEVITRDQKLIERIC
jgi:hypothetical protein